MGPKLKPRVAGPLASYKDGLKPVAKKRYSEKLSYCAGIDPFALDLSAMSQDPADYPDLKKSNIIEFYTKSVCHVDGSIMNVQRGISSYELTVVGYTEPAYSFYVEPRKTFILRGQVRRTHAPNEKKHNCWVLVHRTGKVLCGHCECRTGIGEFCAHVGGLLHGIMLTVADLGISSTSRPNKWAVPPTLDLKAQRIKDIDFTSSNTLLKKLENAPMATDKKFSDRPPAKKLKMVPPTLEELGPLFEALNQSHGSGLLRVLPQFQEQCKTKDPEKLPPSYLEIYSEKLKGKTYMDILLDATEYLENIKLSDQDICAIERVTRRQRKSPEWLIYKSGRPTGSIMKFVCATSPYLPSISLINQCCYPTKNQFRSKATDYGIEQESFALLSYLDHHSTDHQEMKVTEIGLSILKNKPFIASSPDGLVQCKCCGKGVLEIKCPATLENMEISSIDVKKTKFLKKVPEQPYFAMNENHEYYYQVQNHLLCVAGANYCDFVVYTKKELLTIRILPHKAVQNEIILKSEEFFTKCILPELRSHIFSSPLMPPPEDESAKKQSVECYCNIQFDSEHEKIRCSSETCSIKIFHLKCLMFAKEKVPKNWLCLECHKINSEMKKASRKKCKQKNEK